MRIELKLEQCWFASTYDYFILNENKKKCSNNKQKCTEQANKNK